MVSEMKKILIAVESALITGEMERRLGELYQVAVCRNGLDALEMAKDLQPDVMVVDMALPGMDGLSLLQICWDGGIRPKVIALSDFTNAYLVTALEQFGVAALMRCADSCSVLAARIMELAQCEEMPSVEMEIRRILATLGFRMNHYSCHILETAICMYMENPYQHMTTQLYPEVAARCGGSATQVEKAIRDSVDGASKNHDPRIWRMYFAPGRNGKIKKPSNTEFISGIAFCIMDRHNWEKREFHREKIVSL